MTFSGRIQDGRICFHVKNGKKNKGGENNPDNSMCNQAILNLGAR